MQNNNKSIDALDKARNLILSTFMNVSDKKMRDKLVMMQLELAAMTHKLKADNYK